MYALLFSLFFAFTDWYFLPPTMVATVETFTTSGTWSKPDGVTSVTVECWGGGGAGGAGDLPAEFGSGGGAGGQYARKVITYSSPSSSLSYVVGLGGVGARSGDGAAGGDTTWDTNVVIAKGGAGGASNTNFGAGGAGSTTGGVGDIVYRGGSGANADFSPSGGGGGAGSTGNGGDSFGTTGGAGTTQNGGNGADAPSPNSNGLTGNNYGGGGSGPYCDGASCSGGDGGPGLIRITYEVAGGGTRRIFIDRKK